MKIVGLTGGVGTGKSTVARMLSGLGVEVIDSDEVARVVVEPGRPALAELVEAFGGGILKADGSLDRERLAAIAFGDAGARARLNAITHPRIGVELAGRMEALRAAGLPLVVLEIPLLYESGMDAAVDEVVVVWTDEAAQTARIRGRNDWSDEQIAGRIVSQMPLDEKKARAHAVIDNSGSPEETRRQVIALWERWKSSGAG